MAKKSITLNSLRKIVAQDVKSSPGLEQRIAVILFGHLCRQLSRQP
jgi:hypothetical protein